MPRPNLRFFLCVLDPRDFPVFMKESGARTGGQRRSAAVVSLPELRLSPDCHGGDRQDDHVRDRRREPPLRACSGVPSCMTVDQGAVHTFMQWSNGQPITTFLTASSDTVFSVSVCGGVCDRLSTNERENNRSARVRKTRDYLGPRD